MTRNAKRLSVLGLALLVLAGCDGSDRPAPLAAVAQQFGDTFRAAFAQDANATPLDGDLRITFMGIEGPSLTADPVDF